MQKSFTKTGLSVGDKVQDEEGKKGEIMEVFSNSFLVKLNLDTELYFHTFEKAIKEKWTILQNEEETKWEEINLMDKEKTYTFIIFDDKKFVPEEQIVQAIIKNNNELIEEIQNQINNCWGESSRSALEVFKNTIQSKNDLLSKE